MLVATVATAAALVLPSAPHARSVGLPRSLRAGRLLQQLPTESAAAAEAPRLPDDFLAPEEFARRSTAHRNIAQLRVDAPRALSAPPDGSIFSEDICLKGDLGQTLAQGRQACPALQGSEPQASRPHTACYPSCHVPRRPVHAAAAAVAAATARGYQSPADTVAQPATVIAIWRNTAAIDIAI